MSYGTEGYGETPYGFIGTHSIDITDAAVGVLDALLTEGGGIATPGQKPPKPPLPAPPVAGGPSQPPPQHVYRIVPLITRRGG